MNHPIATALQLRPVDQVGFVYRDLDKAIATFEPIFGPFDVQAFGEFDYEFRGEPERAEVVCAFAYSGELQIELIGWVSGRTPHKEFLDAGREGMHHIRFPVDNLDEKVEAAARYGYKPIWTTRFGDGLAVAYLEKEGEPLLLEFFENLHGVDG